jgi:hypothetical protein
MSTCPSYHSLHYFTTYTHDLLRSPKVLCYVTFFHQNIFLNTLFSILVNLCSSLQESYQIWQQYNTTGKLIKIASFVRKLTCPLVTIRNTTKSTILLTEVVYAAINKEIIHLIWQIITVILVNLITYNY